MSKIIIENIKSIQFYIFLPYIYIPILIKHLSTNFIDVMGLAPYKPSREEYFQSYANIINRQDMNYSSIEGLRLEARQKLDAIKPVSIGQASRISGVSPADISVLLIYLEQMRKTRGGNNE